MSLAIALVALQTAGPGTAVPVVLRNVSSLATFDDYPTESLRNEEYGVVSVVVDVTPEGRADGCTVTETSSHARLDQITCSIIKKRGQFEAARDGNGAAVRGTYRTALSWGVSSHMPSVSMSLQLEVAQLPIAYVRPVKTRVLFNGLGRATDCTTQATSGSPQADAAACRYIVAQSTIEPPRSGSGSKPVAVRFVVAALVPAVQR